jgi:hypothetical protein
MTPLSPKSADVKLESVAEIVYRAMAWAAGHKDYRGEAPAWMPNGNSFAQDEARKAARDILAALSPPAHADERVREIADRLNARYRNCKKGGGGHNEEETRAICREAELFLRALPSVSSAEAMRRACAEVATAMATDIERRRDDLKGSGAVEAMHRMNDRAQTCRAIAAAIEALPAPTGDWVLVPRDDAAQVSRFLGSIEGAGYGGMHEYDVAAETMRNALAATPSKEK